MMRSEYKGIEASKTIGRVTRNAEGVAYEDHITWTASQGHTDSILETSL